MQLLVGLEMSKTTEIFKLIFQATENQSEESFGCITGVLYKNILEFEESI